MTKPSIAAVVVTCNRLALLQECVTALQAQTHKPDEIIVVNNGSSDGTLEWLAKQKDLHAITQANWGSAGGQFTGMKTAYLHGHAWFWCMDDDTIPSPTALEKFVATPYFRESTTGFLGSLVLWVDGTPHKMNQPVPIQPIDWYGTVLADRCVRVGNCSFVSIIVSRSAVTAVGLPLKEFFIWGDDVEFSQRIARQFNGYYVLDSVVLHKTKQNTGSVSSGPLKPAEYQKHCYGVRNEIALMMMRDDSLARRGLRVTKFFFRNLWMILRGHAPLRFLAWMLRGLVFRPKPEMVQ